MMSDAKAKSKSDKFPPPHQDAAVGHHPLAASRNGPLSFSVADSSFASSIFDRRSSRSLRSTTSKSGALRSRNDKEEPHRAPARSFMNALYPSSIGWDFGFSRRRTVLESSRDPRQRGKFVHKILNVVCYICGQNHHVHSCYLFMFFNLCIFKSNIANLRSFLYSGNGNDCHCSYAFLFF